jgi:hypothetical protein
MKAPGDKVKVPRRVVIEILKSLSAQKRILEALLKARG